MTSTNHRMRVLVVDDSALVRQTLIAVLGQEGFEVITAADAIIATERLKTFTPDVILLDLEMPHMNGLSFLEKVMAERPLPVVICSAGAKRGSEQALRALELGAVDIVAKPQLQVRDFLYESAVMLSDTIRAAATARMHVRERPAARTLPVKRQGQRASSQLVVAIGASTGGTDALRTILRRLDATAPGIVIVQHMPKPFTRAFARSLDRDSEMEVREAESGDEVSVGCALLAPGDLHMTIEKRGFRYVVRTSEGPLVSRHRPSVDVLFRSVAETAGANAIGILLTGMGSDGANGLAEMRQRGALTIAQDEASSAVFGMPKEAIELGAVQRVLPLSDIADVITLQRGKVHVHS